MSTDDFFAQLETEGVDPDLISRFQEFNSASPLRKVVKSKEREAASLAEENAKLKAKVMAQVFKEADIKVNPSILQLPDDLDITSTEAVTKWGIEMGLRDNTPSAPESELSAHQEVNNLVSGAESPQSGILTPTQAADWPMDKSMKFAKEHPDAWEQLKRGNEVRGLITN